MSPHFIHLHILIHKDSYCSSINPSKRASHACVAFFYLEKCYIYEFDTKITITWLKAFSVFSKNVQYDQQGMTTFLVLHNIFLQNIIGKESIVVLL